MKRAAAFLIAPVVCLAVFWDVLFTWFLNDDFAWLGLRLNFHSLKDLLGLLFHPQAQGTVRVLSERLFFLLGTFLFGIHALPFRLIGLGTWFLVLTVATVVCARLSGSRVAGIAAAIFWTTSYALVSPLSWSSSYNQLLCSLLVLTAFYARLRWLESSDNRWRVVEWGAYLLCFGVLEIVVMYPAAALIYTWWCARKREKLVLALFVPAVAFTAIHLLLVPKNLGDIYTIRVDGHLPATLWTYVRWAVGPSRLEELNVPQWSTAGMAATWLIGLGLVAFALWTLRKGERAPLFCIAWFLLFLAPVLPLPNHQSDYYLTLPLAGLSWLGGWALVRAWRANLILGAASLVLAAAFLAGSITEDSISAAWFRARAERVRELYRVTEQVSAAHPGTALLLQHVDNDLFQSGFQDDPFRLVGIRRVYLAPGSESGIEARQDLGGTSRFTISTQAAMQLAEHNELIVVDVGGSEPKIVTAGFVTKGGPNEALSNFVDVGNSLYVSQLGPEWHRIENGFRWMPKRATVHLAGPKSAKERLYVTGFGAGAALAGGPVGLMVSIKGREVGSVEITEANQPFQFDFPIPEEFVGQSLVDVAVEVSKSFHPPGDSRDLGMIFGTFAVR